MAGQIHSEPKTAPFWLFHALRRCYAKQWALGMGILAVVVTFPDVALALAVKTVHAVWFVLHAVVGVLELSIEHVVELAFHVSRHTAQLITAWILLLMFLLLAVWLARKCLLRAQPSAPNAAQDSGPANRP